MIKRQLALRSLILALAAALPAYGGPADKPAASTAAAKQDLITFSKIDKAWPMSQGKGAKIAVLDWLFDMSPKAADKYLNPTSLIPGEPFGSKEPWHGEWMAGIVHRIAPQAKIIPIRARPAGEQSYEKYLIQGIRLAADQGAAAVTSSMGPLAQSQELTAAIDYAEKKGTVFVDVHPETLVSQEQQRECAPGECDKRIIHPGIVSVPAHAAGPRPNRDIYTWPYDIDPVFQDGWGYSNAPPIVGGVIALIKSANPALSPEQVRSILKATAMAKDGFSVLDAEAAVKKAQERP